MKKTTIKNCKFNKFGSSGNIVENRYSNVNGGYK